MRQRSWPGRVEHMFYLAIRQSGCKVKGREHSGGDLGRNGKWESRWVRSQVIKCLTVFNGAHILYKDLGYLVLSHLWLHFLTFLTLNLSAPVISGSWHSLRMLPPQDFCICSSFYLECFSLRYMYAFTSVFLQVSIPSILVFIKALNISS